MAPGNEVHLQWQVDGDPSTEQTRIIGAGPTGSRSSTTIVLGTANIGTNVISAECRTSSVGVLLTYPLVKVQVLPVAPVLSASPTSVLVGQTITAVADRCPDPDLPRLGASYFVRFRLEYLIPPSGTQGPYSEAISVWSNAEGGAGHCTDPGWRLSGISVL